MSYTQRTYRVLYAYLAYSSCQFSKVLTGAMTSTVWNSCLLLPLVTPLLTVFTTSDEEDEEEVALVVVRASASSWSAVRWSAVVTVISALMVTARGFLAALAWAMGQGIAAITGFSSKARVNVTLYMYKQACIKQ